MFGRRICKGSAAPAGGGAPAEAVTPGKTRKRPDRDSDVAVDDAPDVNAPAANETAEED